MPTIQCTGITTVINNDESAPIVYDDREQMYEIPLHLAERYVEQMSVVPLLLQHKDKYVVGQVDRFHIDETEIDGEKRRVLAADFTIDDESFIQVVKTACYDRQEIYPFEFISSDGFLGKKSSDSEKVDLTANLALMQRLPGLSLQHDGDTFDILELSMCLAGARPCTLLRSAHYKSDAKGKKASKNRMDLFTRFFSSQHAVSNKEMYRKVEKDIQALKMPRTCLVYSKQSDHDGRKDDENSSTTVEAPDIRQPEQTTENMEAPPQHSVTSDIDQQMEALEALSKNFAKSVMQHVSSPQQAQNTVVPLQPVMPVYNGNNKMSWQHTPQQQPPVWNGGYPIPPPLDYPWSQGDYNLSRSRKYDKPLKRRYTRYENDDHHEHYRSCCQPHNHRSSSRHAHDHGDESDEEMHPRHHDQRHADQHNEQDEPKETKKRRIAPVANRNDDKLWETIHDLTSQVSRLKETQNVAAPAPTSEQSDCTGDDASSKQLEDRILAFVGDAMRSHLPKTQIRSTNPACNNIGAISTVEANSSEEPMDEQNDTNAAAVPETRTTSSSPSTSAVATNPRNVQKYSQKPGRKSFSVKDAISNLVNDPDYVLSK